ncbi:hypothetical protein QOT17_000077 [Balamuthia mandrillaris]
MIEDIKTYNILISSLLVQQAKNLDFWKGELIYYLTFHTFPRLTLPESRDPPGGWTSQNLPDRSGASGLPVEPVPHPMAIMVNLISTTPSHC